MAHWEIRVENARDYETADRIKQAKAILPLIRAMHLGGLKESVLFVKGILPLPITSKVVVRAIITFCNDHGLNLEIIEIRLISAKDFDKEEVK